MVIEAYKVQHQKQVGPEPDGKEFWELKEQILICERILLQTLDFDLTVEHAYRCAAAASTAGSLGPPDSRRALALARADRSWPT